MKIVCESSHDSSDSDAINHSDLVKSLESSHTKSRNCSLSLSLSLSWRVIFSHP